MPDKKLFINPFVLGRIRPGEPFCNRKKEQSDLRTHSLNCVDVVLYSSRRLGKTSLLHQVLNSMEHKGYYGIYVDLVSITSESDFIRKVVEGMVLGVGKDVTSRSFPKRIKGLFSRIQPQVEIRPDGVTFSIKYNSTVSLNLLVEDVFHGLSKFLDAREKKALVVLDEFQQIADLKENKKIEGLLREYIQGERNIAYFFVGSRRRILKDMFTDKNRPFYKSAFSYPLGNISKDELSKFVRLQFADTGKNCPLEIAQEIYDDVGGHTYYVQKLSHILWDIAETKATPALLAKAKTELLQSEARDTFENMFQGLNQGEKKLAKALALEPTRQPYAAPYLARYELNAGGVGRNIKSLLDKDLLEITEDSVHQLTDPLFAKWCSM
ncbi:MAG: hypothetical protein CO150_08830 [Nitrospirae bacterium CG_4_9_14_3_um_filter_53_35]|nr:MAG: hypothetical protein AUK29_05465 [Nitrospirae bacterium CG2_30_53_67]PIS37767.1 MAG: hypothetical protein COT35_04265 [Nitrospirae bacterium CG08_land_8_20_14_0_20_52_24]PIV82364.1 MAG: hypothetical protein COW52_13990 [Nitrospirae bacterium CG17_big_fil_post_rev_8_21_14_2_50_50_9]PIW84361.1 MAG: hypothetical protein COZ95_10275 [Nitrospirae bacterium CG_4_8_14_3_um_filter_50_41]PIX85017.1 MAG: hypothetical protein COZ32_10675 [Nitrospirae bacterium CG_4_10_14_3_um_filter_53_41]PJA7305